MRVAGGDLDGNLARAEAGIAEAAAQGAHVALLPECLDLGWTHPSSKSLAQAVPVGEACNRLADAARKQGIHVCAGITERNGAQVFNTAVYFDGSGRLLGMHRKINELEIGHEYYALGDRLNVFETEFGKVGLAICADAFACDLVLTRGLCLMGADIILSPCAWAVDADHDNEKDPYGGLWRDSYGPVAKDFSVWIAGTSNVGHLEAGPWAGRRCIGCSMVVGPDGEVVAQAPYGVSAEAIVYVDVAPVLRPARGCGWESLDR